MSIKNHMNCREFEEQLEEQLMDVDVAGARGRDAARRERVRQHASTCESCAGQWAAEEALSARLLEFGAATASDHASPRIREELRRQVRVSPAAAPAKPAKVVSIESRRRGIRPMWMLAAAAALIACFALASWFRLRTDATASPNGGDLTQQLPLPAPPPSPLGTEGLAPRPTATAAPLLASSRPGSNRSRAQRAANSEKEMVSEFIPLTLAADERAIENGTLVRLAMSRERLIAMGLPLQIEGTQKTINAEVVLGDNGVAYAIRVVR